MRAILFLKGYMKKVVIKIGSSFFINKNKINQENIDSLVKQISILKNKGISCCLISSGAVAVGVKKLELKNKPSNIVMKQACAAIGQMSLMQEYEEAFNRYNIKCAQILLNHDDFGNRKRMISLQQTMERLLELGVVPVVNENDALAVEEIKVGDNDTLSAMTSLAIGADLLVLVSDIDGLYTANPRVDSSATLISQVDKIDDSIRKMAGGAGSNLGTGGMSTKIKAAEIATSSNIPMMIVNKEKINSLSQIADGINLGTLFKGHSQLLLRENWLKNCANISGKIFVDEGAKNAILNRKSILLVGVKKIDGVFKSGDIVEVYCEKDLIAKGITIFDNIQAKKLLDDISLKHQMIIHANNLVIIGA